MTAPSTPKPCAVIVAHGQPSAPAPAEAELAALAKRVGVLLPDWDVRSATLAAQGALAAAVEGQAAPFIYPMFMSDGWFIRSLLPSRLAEAGAAGARILTPFGLEASVSDLCRTILQDAANRAWFRAPMTEVLLAVHGSSKSRSSAEVAERVVAELTVTAGFGPIRAGFIEEDPRIETLARSMGEQALCLPFFAARGGHVAGDIPEALAAAGFKGRLLDPVGVHRNVPGLIAQALRTANAVA